MYSKDCVVFWHMWASNTTDNENGLNNRLQKMFYAPDILISFCCLHHTLAPSLLDNLSILEHCLRFSIIL